ncbi:MAG: orotate phosphoribosyltransferase [Actinomycetota bacterium]|nr:orotate phosphoribosyltransferase [Actinomycetota bacterium]
MSVLEKDELKAVLEQKGAIRTGHFRLSSGLHSDTYVQCAQLLAEPVLALEVGGLLAGEVGDGVDLVLSPALGGIIIGFTTALKLGARMFFAERVEGVMRLRRGFEIPPASSVLIVEDVITTGRSAMELVALVEEARSKLVGVASIVDRGGSRKFACPTFSLVAIEAHAYDEGSCPLCARGVALDDPGSRRLS